MGRLDTSHTTPDNWHTARPLIESDLNKLGKCCIATGIDNATLEADFLDDGFAGVAPETCEMLTIVLNNGSVYWSFDDGANWLNIYVSSASEQTAFATGTIIPFAGDAGEVPADWLLCDGAEISRTTYSDLFDVVGDTYGAGDGSTTFDLPDLRGQTPMGANYSGLPNGENGTYSTRDLADTTGEETHILTESEMASHLHTDNHTSAYSAAAGGSSVSTNGFNSTQSTGDDDPHENMSPFGVAAFIIRT